MASIRMSRTPLLTQRRRSVCTTSSSLGLRILSSRGAASARKSIALAAGTAPASPEPTSQDLSGELLRFYFGVQSPALANRSYFTSMKDFTNRAILAYECGYNEVDLRAQLEHAVLAGNCGLTHTHAKSLDLPQCLLSISLVWLTLMASPKGERARRWSKADAVSDKTLRQWKGFVALIVTAYFEERMAGYPLDRLAMEIAASPGGQPEAPDIIAERAQLVFTTLELVHPQFPTM